MSSAAEKMIEWGLNFKILRRGRQSNPPHVQNIWHQLENCEICNKFEDGKHHFNLYEYYGDTIFCQQMYLFLQ